MPGKASMLDVLRHLPDFVGIAAIVAVAELIVPLLLYLVAFLTRRWAIERELARRASKAGTKAKSDGGDV